MGKNEVFPIMSFLRERGWEQREQMGRNPWLRSGIRIALVRRDGAVDAEL